MKLDKSPTPHLTKDIYQVNEKGCMIFFWLKSCEDILDRFQVAWDNWCEITGFVGFVKFFNFVEYTGIEEAVFSFEIA